MTVAATSEFLEISIQANAPDKETGQRLLQITQGIIAMGHVNAEELTQMAKELVNSASVSSEDELVQAEASLPMSVLIQALVSKGFTQRHQVP